MLDFLGSYEGVVTGMAVISAVILLVQFFSARAYWAAREDQLYRERTRNIRRSIAEGDVDTVDNLRAAGWGEDQIKDWCNNSRCTYYPPEYNSTEFK